MNTIIDRGQAEGAIVQGIGWVTMEDLRYNADGRLLSNALSTYKIPDVYSVPSVLDIHFLETAGSEWAIFHSKAVGEPPLLYGFGAYFALRNVVRAGSPVRFNPTANLPFDALMTPEKVLLGLFLNEKEHSLA